MNDHRVILRRVGLALIVVGLADIAFMAYTIANGQAYSSSFNIFAVVAGIFLMRGSLGAVRVVAWFCAFMLAGFIAAVFLLFPFLQPFGLLVAQARLDPARLVASCLMAAAVFILLVWTYRQLRSTSVLVALEASGRSAAAPRPAIGLGVGLVVIMAIVLNMTLNGPSGARAVELARQKLGPGYNYATRSMQWSGGHGRAVVVAYNDKKVRYIPVEWSE